jgi:sugar (glycoside-pentoside-hexuronide) transporter
MSVPVSPGLPPSAAGRLSFREKAGYALGDAAANFVFQTMLIFQLSFYTDTFGLSAAAAGTLFLVVRAWDAFFDPLVGVIADRTHSRWGKFRPWILWTAVPFGVLACLAFTTPPFGPTGKLVYAYVTYVLLMMVYSANNLPYSALSGVITADPGERTSLSSYRFVAAMLAAFAIQGLAMPMVHHLGGGNNARGYQLTMGLFSALGVIFFLITFFSTRERIHPDPAQKSSVKQDFADLLRNGPWIALFSLTIVVFVGLAMRGGILVYYFKYYLGREDLFGAFNVTGLAANILGILASRAATSRWGKKQVFIAGLGATAAIYVAFFFLPYRSVSGAFVLQDLSQLAYGLTIPLLWTMMADVADYAEWRTGRRATGVVFSALVFGLKAGLGLGGALGGWILSHYGYVASVAQTSQSLLGIRLGASIFAALPFLAGVICLFFYAIDRALNDRIQSDLQEMRRRRAAGN